MRKRFLIFALCLTLGLSACASPAPTARSLDCAGFDEEHIVLSFGVLSDPHINGRPFDSAVRRLKDAIGQLSDWAAADDPGGLDAILVAGDIADSGKIHQAEVFRDVFQAAAPEGVRLYLTTGNHDSFDGDMLTTQSYRDILGEAFFEGLLDESDFLNGTQHYLLGENHLLILAPKVYGADGPYRDATKEWLYKTLDELTTQNPEQYIFVLTHPSLYATTYGSDGGQYLYTKDLGPIFADYPQVIAFSGHLHFPLNDERMIMQSGFTSVSCGSLRSMCIDEGGYENMAGEDTMEDQNEYSQGMLVQVDSSGAVRILRLDFWNRDLIKEPWVLPAPTAQPYSRLRADSNTPPNFSGDARFQPGLSLFGGRGTLLFPAAQDDDMVHHYEITLKNQRTGQVEHTYRVLSDFYRHPQTEDMKTAYSLPITGLQKGGVYQAEIVAVDSWGAVSQTLEYAFEAS